MKRKREIKYMIFFLFCIFFFKFDFAFSQGPPPAADCPTPPCAPVPLDGGVSFLIAAGAAYGVRKIYGLRKNKIVG